MKIIVCLKQVPNTTEIKIDPVTNTLKRDGVASIINPDDKTGLEVALQLKDKFGAHVTVISMGPKQAEKALGEALAMGADRAILLTDRAFAGADTLATSKTIAAAINTLEYDLIIAGRQAIDGDTAQVGPEIAEHLGLPQITYVNNVEYSAEENTFTVQRQFEDGYQLLQVQTPCLFTLLATAEKPRYMRVKGLVDLDKKEVEILTRADIVIEDAVLGLKGSPTKVKQSFNKQYNSNKQKFVLDPTEAAKLIATTLKEKHLI
ncbi:MAG: electron transfer flavoprotein subunit beta/FixA family protein [Clostridia bacterium]|nr:electron transfer flavoprotein subunit beta/FixA family protein [Clostridia bacterium]